MAEMDSNKLTILFADMVGSTRLYDKFGIERGMRPSTSASPRSSRSRRTSADAR